VQWTETHFKFAEDKIQRISSKTLAWEFAVHQQPEGACVCLLDVDTLVRRDLGKFFAEADCDVVFTYKSGGFVLNSGVLLCRINARSRAFFERWRADSVAILGDPERFRQSSDPGLPYGGADQMALHQTLGYREGETHYRAEIAGKTVHFRGEPCEALNETRSVPLGERAHILHYKGGWQPILLDGRRFSRHRPKAVSWEMYLFYLENFERALRRLNEAAGTSFTARDFHLQIPAYVHERNPVLRSLRYASFVAADSLADVFSLGRAIVRRLSRAAAPSAPPARLNPTAQGTLNPP
jgi:hypothetical protein